MATKATAVPLEEYLRTSYEWEPEWVDGELVERPLPNNAHSRAQHVIDNALGRSEPSSRLFSRPGLRVRVSPGRWRIPDLSIFAGREPEGDYPSNVYAAIEILSPDDAMGMVYEKLAEYSAAGVRHLWVVDPAHRRVLKYEDESLLKVDAIEFPDQGFRLTTHEIFAV